MRSGEVALVLSDTYAKRPHQYEMEGISFWDLRKTGEQDLGKQAHTSCLGHCCRLSLTIKIAVRYMLCTDEYMHVIVGVMHMFGNFMTLAEKSIHNFSPL